MVLMCYHRSHRQKITSANLYTDSKDKTEIQCHKYELIKYCICITLFINTDESIFPTVCVDVLTWSYKIEQWFHNPKCDHVVTELRSVTNNIPCGN